MHNIFLTVQFASKKKLPSNGGHWSILPRGVKRHDIAAPRNSLGSIRSYREHRFLQNVDRKLQGGLPHDHRLISPIHGFLRSVNRF